MKVERIVVSYSLKEKAAEQPKYTDRLTGAKAERQTGLETAWKAEWMHEQRPCWHMLLHPG